MIRDPDTHLDPSRRQAFRNLALLLAAALCIWASTASADASERLPEPLFDVTRGHYAEPVTLTLTATAPGHSLRYTLDGGEPGDEATAGRLVEAPPGAPASVTLTVATNTTVRAVAVAEGRKPSHVVSHSYLFPHGTLAQKTPERPAAEWGHNGPDWTMDPDVTGHRDPASRAVDDDLLAIPALVVALPSDALWGEGGIYIAGEGDARDASIELLNPAGDPNAPNALPGLAAKGTVEITGGSSTDRWKTDKLSLRLRFRHGAEFPVFDHAAVEPARQPAEAFHTLILDARLNESWLHSSREQRDGAQHTRDQYAADLQNATGGLAPLGRHVHLYLAGRYWGLYTLHERPDHHFAAAYRGGEPDDWVVVKHHADDVVHGDGAAFAALADLLARDDIGTPGAWEAVNAVLDVEDFARYMLLNYWAGNTDWSHQNWYASHRPGTPDGRWRFHSWDAEHTLKALDEDVTGKDDPAGPTGFHRRLMRNPAYRALFAETVRAAQAPGGLLDPAAAAERYRQRAEEVDAAIRAESARWGDNRRRRPYTRGADWIDERDRLLEDYFPKRAGVVLDQLRRADWID